MEIPYQLKMQGQWSISLCSPCVAPHRSERLCHHLPSSTGRRPVLFPPPPLSSVCPPAVLLNSTSRVSCFPLISVPPPPCSTPSYSVSQVLFILYLDQLQPVKRRVGLWHNWFLPSSCSFKHWLSFSLPSLSPPRWCNEPEYECRGSLTLVPRPALLRCKPSPLLSPVWFSLLLVPNFMVGQWLYSKF